jgi:hypothetical protein
MALANVADLLARRGVRVLMIDFDLEAPGLEQFFHLNIEGIRRNPGLLDMLLAYKQSMSVASGSHAFKDVTAFISSVYKDLPGGGKLDIMAAGQRQEAEQLARYALALRSFDWQDFYYNWEGDLFFEWLRRELATDRYDLVLVDSRTGVTEMGGICGYQLADTIVMLSAPNTQNLQGTSAMLRDFRSASVESLRRGRPLDIVVVPARVEQRDPALLEEFFRRFDEAFAGILPKPLVAAGISARDLMVPYEPLYAFNERVVSEPGGGDEGRRISAVFETLAEAVALLAEPTTRLGRVAKRRDASRAAAQEPAAAAPAPAEARYDPARRFAGYDVFVDSSTADDAIATRLVEGLQARNLHVFRDRADVSPGADWVAVVEEALFHSRALVFCVGAGPLPQWRAATLEKAAAARRRGQSLQIIPVLVPGAEPEALRATLLASFQWVDVRGGIDERALGQIHQALGGDQPTVETQTRAPYVGAKPFEEQHPDLFFGRETVIKEILAHIDGGIEIVVIVGPSGSGKTSLVRAGVLPALRGRAPRERWLVASVRLSRTPFTALKDALIAIVPEGGPGRSPTMDPDAAIAAVLGTDESRRLLVFVDGAEALCALDVDDAERARLVEAVRAITASHRPRVTVLIGLRSDERDAFVRLTPAWQTSSKPFVELEPLTVDELRQMVQGPAERIGLAFEPGLVDRILADLQRGSSNLGLGQELLVALWERRRAGWLTNDAYSALGGLQGIIIRRADALWDELDETERLALRALLLRLVRLTSTEGTRERVPRRVVAPGAGTNTARRIAHERVLALLIDRLLVVAVEHDGEPAVVAAHEGLVQAWPRLRQWVEEDRQFLEWRERVDVAVGAWRTAGKSADLLLRGPALSTATDWIQRRAADLNEDETAYIRAGVDARATREKRRTLLIGSVTGLVLLGGVFGGGAYLGWKAAGRNLKTAQDTTQRALDQARTSQAQFTETQNALEDLQRKLDALQSVAESATQQAATATAERGRAERAARELSSQLNKLQAEAASKAALAERNWRQSTEQVKELERIQRTLGK